MSVTQKQLAEQFHVSQVTVSRALRGTGGVGKELSRAIRAAAVRKGYHIDGTNHDARRLRQRACGQEPRANIICALVNDEDDPFGFGGRILKGMNDEAARTGCELVMISRSMNRLPLIVTRRQVDGVVRLMGDIEWTHGAAHCPVPWVSVLYDVPGIDLVTVDNHAGACAVGRHVCAAGHRRIAFIGPDTDLARERLAGLRAAAAEAGAEVPDSLVHMRRYVASDRPTLALLDCIIPSKHDGDVLPFTALVAYNDYMAALAIQRLRERGWAVPEEVGVAGFDGLLPGWYTETSITSAAMPLEELGAQAIQVLNCRIENPEAPRRKTVLPTTLVTGETLASAQGVRA